MTKLLGQSERYAIFPGEVRFHIDRNGLGELLQGVATLEDFIQKLRGWFFRRQVPGRRVTGLYRILSETELESAIDRFLSVYPESPGEAAGELFRDLLGPEARRQECSSWVESSPATLHLAPIWASVLPEAKFLHMVRDGRDVAASVVAQTWGPKDPIKALKWWGENLRHSWVASSRLSERKVKAIRLENLVSRDRESIYEELLDWLELPDEPQVRHKFESMDGDRANLGRWREAVPAQERREFERAYEQQLNLLAESGMPASLVEPFER